MKTKSNPKNVYSSSDIITAAEEIKFKQEQVKNRVDQEVASGKKTQKQADDELRKAYTTLAHTYDRAKLAKEYKTDLEKGLTREQAAQLLTEYGKNELTPPEKEPWWLTLLKSIFGGFFNVLLWVGSILCFIAYAVDPNDPKDSVNLYLGIVLSVVVTLTGIFGYYQESKSANLMEGLSKMMPPNVNVTRDGEKLSLSPIELVPGDLVELTLGMQIPADIRIVKCTPDMEV